MTFPKRRSPHDLVWRPESIPLPQRQPVIPRVTLSNTLQLPEVERVIVRVHPLHSLEPIGLYESNARGKVSPVLHDKLQVDTTLEEPVGAETSLLRTEPLVQVDRSLGEQPRRSLTAAGCTVHVPLGELGGHDDRGVVPARGGDSEQAAAIHTGGQAGPRERRVRGERRHAETVCNGSYLGTELYL